MYIFILLFILINSFFILRLITNNKINPKVLIFIQLIILLILWTLTTYFSTIIYIQWISLLMMRLTMAFTLLLPITLYLFVKNLNTDTLYYFRYKKITIITTLLVAIFCLSPYVIENIQYHPFILIPGVGIYIYILYLLFWFFTFLIYLYKEYSKSKGYEKIVISYFLTGLTFTFILASITNLILPVFFHIDSLLNIGPLTTIFATSYMYYVLTRIRINDLKNFWQNIITYLFFTSFIFLIIISLDSAINSYINNLLILIIDLVIISIFYIILYNKILAEIGKNKYFSNYDTLKFRDSLNNIINQSLDIDKGIDDFKKYIITKSDISDLFFYIQDILIEKNGKKLFKYIQDLEVEDNIIFVFEIHNDAIKTALLREGVEVISVIKDINNNNIGAIFWKNKINFNFYLLNDLNFIKSETKQINLFITRAILFKENKDLVNNLQEKVSEATKELENNNKKLENANEDLKGLAQLKDDLISISSHELRTPASIVKGNVYMAQSAITSYIDTLPKSQQSNEYIEKLSRYIQRSIESIESEIRLINTLLEASRMGKSDIPIIPENLDIVSMIESQVDGFKKEANNKGLRLIYHKKEIPMIYGDRTKVEEIIGNLISNAIKYSERGSIDIHTEEDKEYVTVHIKDNGVGIPEEEIPLLFQKFHRLNNYIGNPNDPKDRKHLLVRPGGTGLGLYVVKGLVERMGGRIWIDSKVGEGSTFSFTLPIAKDIKKENNNSFKSQDVFKKLKLK